MPGPSSASRSLLAAVAIGAGLWGGAPTMPASAGEVVDYDIVYVRQARYGDLTNTTWPEVFHPARLDPGADLMLLHPDGSQERLVRGGDGGVTDPFVSFDAEYVYYAYFPDLREEALNGQRDDLPEQGADIHRIHLASRSVERLTFGEFTPNTGAGIWDESNPLDPPSDFNRLGYGILNLGPCPLPDGRVAFTSNRNGFDPPKGFTSPTMQLYVMDADGSNVEAIAPMTISSALHPTVLQDGRMLFSTHESQALRDRRLWGIWAIDPDGRHWEPIVSAFRGPQAFHFMTQLSGGDLVVVDYYNLNNNGFGALYRVPLAPRGEPAFHSGFPSQNPAIDQTVGQGFSYPFRMAFTPKGMVSITPFTHGNDEAAPIGSDGVTRVGKFTHPSGAPQGDLLVVWTPGPANDLNRPTPLPRYDAGLYLIPGGDVVESPGELVEILNDPSYNEAWPRAVVPYADVHGVAEPLARPWLPNDGSLHPDLPPGTPYGLVGSSSFYKRESFPGSVTSWSNEFDGLDSFNTSENGQSSNWGTQGSDVGRYDDSEIWAVRIVGLEPNTHRSYGPHSGRHFVNHASERHRILGEIPLRKFESDGSPVLDPEGNPDTSFLAKIPADTPFTFQTIDRNGLVLNMAQTWHQVRPGEVRTDCGGCHAHSKDPLAFADTAAADPSYPVYDLAKVTPLVSHDDQGDPTLRLVNQGAVDVEFYRDIRPLLERSCVSCHTGQDADPPADLVLDDHSLVGGLPGDYRRLAADSAAEFGIPPIISNGTWRQTNASRYLRKYQGRRSLLLWKIFGARLDGWSNDDHPTEAVPGNAATLPFEADPNDADIDFLGDAMPPPDGDAPALDIDEKMAFGRWIALGAPINSGAASGHGDWGWFLDDLRPTLTVSTPRAGFQPGGVRELVFGAVDAVSGIDPDSFSVRADFPVLGHEAGAELAGHIATIGDGIYRIAFGGPLPLLEEVHLFVEVADRQGNITRVARRFSTAVGLSDIFADGFDDGGLEAWALVIP